VISLYARSNSVFFPRSIQRTSDNSDLPQLPETFDRVRVCVFCQSLRWRWWIHF